MSKKQYYDCPEWKNGKWRWQNLFDVKPPIDLDTLPEPIKKPGERILFHVTLRKGVTQLVHRDVEAVKMLLYVPVDATNLSLFFDRKSICYKTELHGHTAYIPERYLVKD